MKRSRGKNEESLDDYTIGNQIGSGGFANIYVASKPDGTKYALKKIIKGKQKPENIEREINAGLLLRHPNVGQFVGHFEDEKSDALLFEYIRGNSRHIFESSNSLRCEFIYIYGTTGLQTFIRRRSS